MKQVFFQSTNTEFEIKTIADIRKVNENHNCLITKATLNKTNYLPENNQLQEREAGTR